VTNEELVARLEAIERRLTALESADLSGEPQRHSPPPQQSPVPQHSPPSAQSPRPQPAARGNPSAQKPRSQPIDVRDLAITNVLGWAGAVALVLAATYLIRLAINAGWLTPGVQIAGAALLGLLLIGAGFGLKGVGHRYAGLLPAAGVAILFLSVYGAHLLYHIASAHEAAVAVIVVCAISLGLCASFDSDLYALFAVAASYSAPFLIEHGLGSFSDIALYYCAWSLTFTLFAIFRGRRLIYLLALYVGLVGFDALARSQLIDWRTLVEFQTLQFAIFAVGAAIFSIRWRAPIDERAALFHLPALLLFYALQYVVLKAHLPQAAPWIAVGSLLAVGVLYLAARLALGRPSPGVQLLLGAYAALVLFHAGYLELLPASSTPWVALGVVVAALLARREWSRAGAGLSPLLLAVGAMFILSLLQVLVAGAAIDRIPGHQVLGAVYAVMLYIGYRLTWKEPGLQSLAAILLYAGHVTAMSTTLRVVDERILQSLVWGLLALAAMAWSVVKGERQVAQSALVVFAATAVKVMLYDLHGAAPLARIVGLFVLGIAFYVGGLLYQRLTKPEARSELRT
jgi:uncharacterized membrane protein